MRYSQGFFDLNLGFAAKAAEVMGLPLTEALLDYTHLYLSFGLGRRFDPADDTWQSYLAGLKRAASPGDWTYRFYLDRQSGSAAPSYAPRFGCFSFAVWDGGRIRLHFIPQQVGPVGPLNREEMPARMAELHALFSHIREKVASPRTVVGGSWLYNLEAYRRLFPPAYLATAHVEEPEYQFVAQWGQFLDRRWQIRPDSAAEFRARLRRATTSDQLTNCFPYPVLRLESGIEPFYEFYRI